MGYYNAGIGAARINDSSPSDYTTYSGNKIETKQNATDNTLTTTSKNIVGAINEINSKVNNKFIIVQTLPVSDIDEFAIYLIPKSTSQTDNIYDEYIYISTDTPAHWEKIGDTEIDLSGYYTSSQVDGLLSNKQNITDNSLTTVDKHINGAINELHAINGYSYDEYDATTAYSTGDLCIYNNVLYKAKQATTGNLPTNTTYWEQTSIADEINELKSGKQDNLIIDNSNSSSAISLNGTYQIPASVLSHTFVLVGVRRAGLGNYSIFKTSELLQYDNGFTLLATGGGYVTLTCSSTGLLKVTNIQNMNDPYIFVSGIL